MNDTLRDELLRQLTELKPLRARVGWR